MDKCLGHTHQATHNTIRYSEFPLESNHYDAQAQEYFNKVPKTVSNKNTNYSLANSIRCS